jgi:predicted phosphodiesterase
VRTIVASDLHLAAGTDADLVRDPRFREVLLGAVEGADRVVLLGDVLELRDRPLADALELAAPFFAELGEVAAGAEVLVVPGNHDHHLLESWLARRRLDGSPPLGLEERAQPEDFGPLAPLAAQMGGGATLELVYPGVWLRPDVYATHGHYLDRHLTIPTFERLALATVERILGPPPSDAENPLAAPGGSTDPDEYERALAPVYAFLFALAQGAGGERRGPGPSARVWSALSGGATRAAKLRGWLLGSVAVPGAVGVANRLGLGPVRSDLSPSAITKGGLEAIGEVAARLEIGADHLIYGHTHRRGPLGDESGWTLPGGGRLHNTGSWVYTPNLLGRTAATSPYWPGTVAIVDDEGPPRLEHLLDELERAELPPAHARG